MEWFNRAYAQGDPQLMVAPVHPVYDNIQGDPRFQELLMKPDLL